MPTADGASAEPGNEARWLTRLKLRFDATGVLVPAAGPAAPADGLYFVEFRLEIAGPSLLEGAPEERGENLRLELVAYVITRSGELETTLGRRIHVPSSKLDELRPGGGIRFIGHLEVPAGEHRLCYILEGGRRIPDPTIAIREKDDFGGENSILAVNMKT